MLAAIAAITLAGCATAPMPVKSDPLDVGVPLECAQACVCDVPPLAITQDPYSAVNAAKFEHDRGKACLSLCDTRRQGCADAIKRARAHGAIK